MLIIKYFLWFMLYSIVGWIWEVALYLVEDRRFVNRGFFNGPYCPIYGAGALLDILILGRIKDAGLLFVLGVLLTGVLEYLTSYVLEKWFHARWWDYSERKFNINGRVCLAGMICFGIMSVFLIKLAHPFAVRMTDKIPDVALIVIGGIVFAAFVYDVLYTVIHIKGFNKKLAELHTKIQENLYENLEKARSFGVFEKVKLDFEDSELKIKMEEAVSALRDRMNKQEQRILKAFPKLKSVKHNDIFEKIRNKK